MENLRNLLLTIAVGLFLISCGGESQTEDTSEEVDEATEATTEAVETTDQPAESKYSGETAVNVVHSVTDVTAWIEVYERVSDPEARIGYRVSNDDPNLLLVYELTESHSAAREQFASDDLKNDMAEAGVIGDVQFTYVDIKDVDEEDSKTYLMGLAHEVEDYDAWKPVFDADSIRRSDGGLKFEALLTDADNPNMVYIWFSTDDLDKAMEVLTSDDLKLKMQEAGVTNEPTISVWVTPDTGA